MMTTCKRNLYVPCPSEKPYPDEKLKPRLMNFLMGMVYSLTDLKKQTKMRLKLALNWVCFFRA